MYTGCSDETTRDFFEYSHEKKKQKKHVYILRLYMPTLINFIDKKEKNQYKKKYRTLDYIYETVFSIVLT